MNDTSNAKIWTSQSGTACASASSGFNTGKAERAGGRRLLAVVGGKEQVDPAPIANGDCACQMKRVERLDDRRHRLRGSVNNRPGQADSLDCFFYLRKLLDCFGNFFVIENPFETQPTMTRQHSRFINSLEYAASHCAQFLPNALRSQLS